MFPRQLFQYNMPPWQPGTHKCHASLPSPLFRSSHLGIWMSQGLIFYIQPQRYWSVLVLEKGRLNWKDELCTGLWTLTNSGSGKLPEEAGFKGNDFSLKRLCYLQLNLGRAYRTFSGNSNEPALLKLKLHVIFILLTMLKEVLHSFLNFVAWIVIHHVDENSQTFLFHYRQWLPLYWVSQYDWVTLSSATFAATRL